MKKELKKVTIDDCIIKTELITMDKLPPAKYEGLAIDVNSDCYDVWRDYFENEKLYCVKSEQILFYRKTKNSPF